MAYTVTFMDPDECPTPTNIRQDGKVYVKVQVLGAHKLKRTVVNAVRAEAYTDTPPFAPSESLNGPDANDCYDGWVPYVSCSGDQTPEFSVVACAEFMDPDDPMGMGVIEVCRIREPCCGVCPARKK